MGFKRGKMPLPPAALLLFVLFAGCAGMRSGPVEDKPPGWQPDGGLHAAAAAVAKRSMTVFDWNQEYANTAVIFDDVVKRFNERTDLATALVTQRIPGEPYWTKLNAMVAVNDAPDIFATHASGKLRTYKDAKKIIALNAALEADREWRSRFKDGVFDLMTFDGQIYGMPVSLTAAGLFYNKDIFERYGLKPPATYDELKLVVAALTAEGVIPFAFGAKEPWTAALFSELVANRIGGSEPFDRIMDGEGSWEDPSFVSSGYAMQELAGMGAFPADFLELDYVEMTSLFKQGKAAMMVMGSWLIGSTLEADSRVRGKIGVVKFPAFPGGKGDIDTWLVQPDYNFAISASADDPAAAVQFLKMWSEPEIQARIVKETGKIPAARSDIGQADMPELTAELDRLMQDMKDMFIYYDVGLGNDLGESYNTTIQSILAGKKPEEAFAELQAYAERNR